MNEEKIEKPATEEKSLNFLQQIIKLQPLSSEKLILRFDFRSNFQLMPIGNGVCYKANFAFKHT